MCFRWPTEVTSNTYLRGVPQVLEGRRRQLEDKMEENKRRQLESIESREELLRELEAAQRMTARERKEEERRRREREEEIQAQVRHNPAPHSREGLGRGSSPPPTHPLEKNDHSHHMSNATEMIIAIIPASKLPGYLVVWRSDSKWRLAIWFGVISKEERSNTRCTRCKRSCQDSESNPNPNPTLGSSTTFLTT